MTDSLDQLTAALADRYTIVRELGRGGMATVYLADDLKHHRKVALKVLRAQLAAVIGAERFLREIDIAANLTHPHILPLFDSGRVTVAGDSRPGTEFLYYAMPYVEGESLRDRLNREGQLPLEDAVRIAREVADGLAYAHDHGVVHRDIKPENVLLSGNHALIADFGIARAVDDAGHRLTETGLSIGTPEYMSPEQATGSAQIDGRTDIYSLGCLVYEMLVGEPPHTGANPQIIAAKVLTQPVRSMRESRPTVPESIDAAVTRALASLPADRHASARDFADALAAAGVERISGTVPAAAAPRSALPKWAFAIAATAVAVAAVIALWRGPPGPATPQQPTARFPVEVGGEQGIEAVLPEGQSMEFSGMFGSAVAISADGSQVAYVASGEGDTQLFLRRIDEMEAKPIPGTEGARAPFFSPDGNWIGFYAGAEIKKVNIDGSTPLTLAGIDIAMFGASWADDQEIYLGHCTNGLERLSASGGEREPVTRVGSSDPNGSGRQHEFPQVLPGGEWLLFTVFNGSTDTRLDVVSLRNGERRTVVDHGTYGRYLPSGHLVWAWDGKLMAAPFDVKSVRLTGPAVPVLDGVLMEADRGAAHFDVSDNGTLVYIPGGLISLFNADMVWVDRTGKESPFDLPAAQTSMRISPDGRRVLVSRPMEAAGLPDLWVYDLEGRTQIRLTDDQQEDWWTVWSPDGASVIYMSGHGQGPFNLYRIPWDGSAPPERLTESGRAQIPSSISSDGMLLAYSEADDANSQPDIWVMELDGDRTAHPFLATPAFETDPMFSPDGRWMAYMSNESGRWEVYVRPYPGPGAARRVSTDGGHQPLWSPDGQALYYRWGGQVLMATLETGADLAVKQRAVLFEGPYVNTRGQYGRMYDISRDGKRFLMLKAGEPPPPATHYNVVLNWFSELERLAPTGRS
ncbi:MAG: serine/threonine-protein kinase [Gemmatimonadetes bacterium]|nr:serine/threonine-protein kinase [Gemmatimonadota bacterium]